MVLCPGEPDAWFEVVDGVPLWQRMWRYARGDEDGDNEFEHGARLDGDMVRRAFVDGDDGADVYAIDRLVATLIGGGGHSDTHSSSTPIPALDARATTDSAASAATRR
mmetsp:Transcript_50876/g.124997  ORF Transcript_50876/g.124997 Transcript_50876/m.124997 type:complete len:108 (+) Transcript_50876:1226-1549(+)